MSTTPSSATKTTAPATRATPPASSSPRNLRDWEYVGPFYKSDRKWTEEIEDCACSNFFPFGDKHMLLMHTHRPYGKAQYYIGRYQDQQFHPEIHGQLTHLGSLVAGPETLVDDRGRRLFWGWIREARGDDWVKHGWNSIMTLPWHLTPAGDNTLRIDPVAELRALRYDERRHPDVTLSQGEERTLHGFQSDCMEIKLTIQPNHATRFGLKLLCSPDGQEETVVTYDTQRQHFIVDFDRSSLDPNLTYGRNARDTTSAARQQIVPFPLPPNAPLHIDLFIDRSVIEIFVNSQNLHRPARLPHPPRQHPRQTLHPRSPHPRHQPNQIPNGRHQPLVIPRDPNSRLA